MQEMALLISERDDFHADGRVSMTPVDGPGDFQARHDAERSIQPPSLWYGVCVRAYQEAARVRCPADDVADRIDAGLKPRIEHAGKEPATRFDVYCGECSSVDARSTSPEVRKLSEFLDDSVWIDCEFHEVISLNPYRPLQRPMVTKRFSGFKVNVRWEVSSVLYLN
jgi:hypothetical protein